MNNKVMDFNTSRGTDWYKGTSFTNGDLVTDGGSNRALGIKDIRFSKPRGNHNRVVATVTIELVNDVRMYGTVYWSKDFSNLTFGVEQRKYENPDKTIGYADINVRIPRAIQAQVLRHAETRMVEAPVAEVQQYQAPVQEAPAPAPVQEVQQQQKPAVGENLAAMLKGASPEQIQAIMNSL